MVREILTGVANTTKSWSGVLFRAFDIRDFFVLGGLAILWRGLYLQYGEAVSLIVCGGLVFVTGCIMVFAGKR